MPSRLPTSVATGSLSVWAVGPYCRLRRHGTRCAVAGCGRTFGGSCSAVADKRPRCIACWRCFSLAVAWAPGWPLAQGACEAETATLTALARGVQLDITAPAGLRSGGCGARCVARRVPLSAEDAGVRGGGHSRRGPHRGAAAAQAGTERQAGPGRQCRTRPAGRPRPSAAARAPLDLAFGAGKTRLLVPLYQPGSKLAGSVDVRVFDAGALALEARWWRRPRAASAVSARPSCREINVAPGTPEIVVQDPFDIDVPKRIVISNSGRYRLHVFEGRYRVFELATGAKLVDRAGHNPNFSPTSRFVVADVGDADGRELEVIDLVSQQVIYTAAGPVRRLGQWRRVPHRRNFAIWRPERASLASSRGLLRRRSADDPQDTAGRRPGS